MSVTGKVFFALSFVGASAIRHRKNRNAKTRSTRANSTVTSSTAGEIAGLYTYGAPASSDDPLRNMRSPSGCFPGLRMWNSDKFMIGKDVDLIVPLAGLGGYDHLYQDCLDFVTNKGETKYHPCSEDSTQYPIGFHGKSIGLHERGLYIEHASRYSDLLANMSHVGMANSYVQDEQEAAKNIEAKGWRLVHTAHHDGKGTIAGGYQVSHLAQQPDSLECIITFQGSDSLEDWIADFDVIHSDFCGFRKVHRGFRDHLRRITRSTVFQNKIRPYLPGCSKVHVIGHSLGAAMAELFSACVQRAPLSGEPGYDDYKYMGWTTAKAAAHPYVTVK